MQREIITSATFDEIGYDPDEQVLEVLFNDGLLVQYNGVPPEHGEELLMKVVGAYENYFNTHIDGKYEKVVLEEASDQG